MKFLRIILAAASLAAAASGAVAQEQPAGAPGTKAVEEVIITGTRRTDRTVAESTAPIDVLSGNDLAIEPSGSMTDTLSSLVPSFIVGQNSISDASSFVRSPSLRGLPADEMLVMLDGKRYNRSALVQVFYGGQPALAFGSQGPDVGALPSLAVKSLEILRDGASAQYGSDAIAGVLNYQLRDNSSGIELTSRLGSYFPTGYSRDGTDRQISGNIGLPLGGQGFVNLNVEWSKYDQTVRKQPQDGGGTWNHHPAFNNIYLDPCTSQPTFTGCPAGGWIQDSNVFNFGVVHPNFPNAPFYPAGFTPRFYGTTQEFFGTVG